MVTSTYLPLTLAFFFPESTCTGYTHEVPISILAAVKVFRTHKDVPHSEIKIIWGKDLRPIQTSVGPWYAQGEKFQNYKKIHKLLHESCITFLLRLIHLCLIWNAEHTRHVCTINCVCDVRESALHKKLVGFFFPQIIKTRWYSDCLHIVVFKESLFLFFFFPSLLWAVRQSPGKCFPARLHSALNCLNYVSVYCLSGASSS